MVKKNLKEIQKDAVGITMTFQTGISLLNTTSLKLVLKVGTTKIERNLTEENISDANLGTVTYITQEGDLDKIGEYKGQVIDNTDGVYLPSKVFEFRVVGNVE